VDAGHGLDERGQIGPPHVGGATVAVQADDERAAPAAQDADGETVEGESLVGEGRGDGMAVWRYGGLGLREFGTVMAQFYQTGCLRQLAREPRIHAGYVTTCHIHAVP